MDLTPLAALHCTDTTVDAVLWRRAVYLVDRGDGLEWIVLHPAHDGADYARAAGLSCGVRGEDYEGSPARSLVSMLSTLWPAPPRVRWILDDAPLIGAGEVR